MATTQQTSSRRTNPNRWLNSGQMKINFNRSDALIFWKVVVKRIMQLLVIPVILLSGTIFIGFLSDDSEIYSKYLINWFVGIGLLIITFMVHIFLERKIPSEKERDIK